ncbi:MAG: tRNA (adenosine(37)-N6)-threonylcarbamoyltransferase complex dimerization subunit type 1 TsaB [Actinomycetota bacterium]
MIVLGIDTATPQTSVALGTERGTTAQMGLAVGRSHEEIAVPAIEHLLRWSGTELSRLSGIVVGIGPGLFTGLRVGVETARTLAQVLHVPILGIPSLDVLAFPLRDARRSIGAVIDARRGEVFFALYRPVPGGVARVGEFTVSSPEGLVAELQARGEEVVLVGDGALRYRRELAALGGQVEFASPSLAYPQAACLVELSVPRLEREEFDRVADVLPLYLRKSDAEIAWDKRTRAG